MGGLAQGINTRIPTGINTILFINKNLFSKHKNFTYGQVVDDTHLRKY